MWNDLKTIYYTYTKEVWYLTFIVLINVCRKTIFNVSRQVGTYDTSLDSGTSLALIAIILSIMAIWKYKQEFSYVRKANFSFIAYYILCLSSFLWAGHFGVIAFKAIEVLCCFGVIGLIINKIESLKLGVLYIITISTLITYVEVLNGFIRYGYLFHHTNTYSLLAMIALLLCIGSIRYNVFYLGEIKHFIWLNALALVGGTSSASWISFIIGVIILYSMNENGVGIFRTIIVCVVIYVAYTFAFDIISDIIFKGKTKEMIESGHGRQVIWDAAIASWKSSPLLGNGFLIGERSLGRYGLSLQVISVHNSFLSVLVGTGITGIVLFSHFLFKWFRIMLTFYKFNRYAVIMLPVAVAIVVNCMAFPAIGSDWNFVAPVVYAVIAFVFLHINDTTDIEDDIEEDLL